MRGFEAYIAQRYLRTRRKGAFVRVMVGFARWGIALGVFALVITLALMNGFREEIQANLFSATAHFTIQHLSGEIRDTPATLAQVRKVPGVVAASPIRFEKGLLKPARSSAPPEAVAAKAVDPASAGLTSSIFQSLRPGPIAALKEGRWPSARTSPTAWTCGWATTWPSPSCAWTWASPACSPRWWPCGWRASSRATSASTTATGSSCTWPTPAASPAARRGDDRGAHRGVDQIDTVKPAVLAALRAEGRGGFVASDLRDTNKPLFAALRVEKWMFAAVLGLIVLVAAFNIVASLVLLVTEKRRDLGVLLALGATPTQVRRLFELQGLRIGAVGTLWGLGLSVPFCLVADRFRLVKLPSAVYDFITYVPFRLHLPDLVVVVAFPMLVAWWASRYPARRAAGVDPVDALRAQ